LSSGNPKKILNYDVTTSGDSPDTPNLLNVRKLDSIKRYSLSRNDSTGEMSGAEASPVETSGKKSFGIGDPVKLSKKPPIDKRPTDKYKLQSPKPIMQGWLYKRKQTASGNSNSNGSVSGGSSASNGSASSTSSSSGAAANKSLIRSHVKWKHYWCMFIKDYIVLYKQVDDKTPSDYLILKDFNITPSKRKYGFILYDKSKQAEHEFYAESNEEFKEWYQSLLAFQLKLNSPGSASVTDNISISSSSGYDSLPAGTSQATGANSSSDEFIISSMTPQPSSSSLSRKNNLHLQLSTIIDSSDDLSSSYGGGSGGGGIGIGSSNGSGSSGAISGTGSSSNGTASTTNSKLYCPSSPKTSPTLLYSPNSGLYQSQQSYNSSRESSPGISISSKLNSRDSSPSLIYRKSYL
jgi:hypothetical protein